MQSIIKVLALAATASAATISISVGQDGALAFAPNTTTAAIGDTLEFHFYSGSGPHSVVLGSYASPCLPASASSFFSGYITGTSTGNDTFSVSVTSTAPMWIYCSAKQHCQNGMVGVINPPSNATVDDFAAAAMSVAAASAPASSAEGGTLATATAAGTGSGAGSTGSMSMTSTGSTASATSSTSKSVSSATSAASSASASATKASGAENVRAGGVVAAVAGVVALLV